MIRIVILGFLAVVVCYIAWNIFIVPMYRFFREDQVDREKGFKKVEKQVGAPENCGANPDKPKTTTKPKTPTPKNNTTKKTK